MEIASRKSETLLITKSEWGVNPIPQMGVEYNDHHEVTVESEDLMRMTRGARAQVQDTKRKKEVETLSARRQD